MRNHGGGYTIRSVSAQPTGKTGNLLKMNHKRPITILFALLLGLLSMPVAACAAKCLYISSYHKGYEWNDGIERGMENILHGKCELDRFYMDTKRHREKEYGKEIALQAKAYIEQSSPDILIAADDNASRYLIQPYYKNSPIPVVFCGINYTVKPYGYPYNNATGMLEISPIRPVVKLIKSQFRKIKHGIYLGPDVISQHREFELNRERYASKGIRITPIFVKNMGEWVAGYNKAQQNSDLLIIGNNGGIENWSDKEARKTVLTEQSIFSVTSYDWMNRYAMLAITKVPEEQGEWAAKVAVAVLAGERIKRIPIIANRRWNIFTNTTLLNMGEIKLPRHLMLKAIKVSL